MVRFFLYSCDFSIFIINFWRYFDPQEDGSSKIKGRDQRWKGLNEKFYKYLLFQIHNMVNKHLTQNHYTIILKYYIIIHLYITFLISFVFLKIDCLEIKINCNLLFENFLRSNLIYHKLITCFIFCSKTFLKQFVSFFWYVHERFFFSIFKTFFRKKRI